jgi:hypothetical protein
MSKEKETVYTQDYIISNFHFSQEIHKDIYTSMNIDTAAFGSSKQKKLELHIFHFHNNEDKPRTLFRGTFEDLVGLLEKHNA